MAIVNASLTTSAQDVFTCSNSAGSMILAVIFYNSDSVEHNVNLHACPADEAPVVENQLLKVAIPAGESYAFDTKMVLSNTDTLTALNDEANTSTAVGITVSYENL